MSFSSATTVAGVRPAMGTAHVENQTSSRAIPVLGKMVSQKLLIALAIATLAIPIAVSSTVALSGTWMPTADRALMSLQVSDTLAGDVALVGVHSTSSQFESETSVSHAGPLAVWLLAPFVLVAGPVVGMVVGAAAVNIASVVALVLVSRRTAGIAHMLVMTSAAGALMFVLRGEMLRDPWTPHLALLPTLALLAFTFSVATGDRKSFPYMVAFGSFVSQAHVTYLPVVAGICIWGLVAFVVVELVQRSRDVEQWMATTTELVRCAGISTVVGLACWSGPLVDQFFGEGNLFSLVEVAGDPDVERLGIGYGISRTIGSLGAIPVWMSRTDNIFSVRGEPGTLDWIVGGTVVAAMIAALVLGWSRRSRELVALNGTALVSLAVASFAIARAPSVSLDKLYWFRWLWPVGMFTTLVLVWSAVRVVLPHLPGRVREVGMSVAALPVAVVLVLGFAQPGLDRDLDGPRYGYLAELTSTAAENLDHSGRYLVEAEGTLFWHKGTVVAALERSGVDVRVVADNLTWGDSRLLRENDQITGKLVIAGGPDAGSIPAEATQVAFVPVRAESQEAVSQRVRDQLRGVPLRTDGLAEEITASLISGADLDEIRTRWEVNAWPEHLLEFFDLLVATVERDGPEGSNTPLAMDLDSLSDKSVLSIVGLGFVDKSALSPDVEGVLSDPLFGDGYGRTERSGMVAYLLPG